ncbi:MAG: DUF4388 domain-containing protein [Pseudomonadota bacterium]
MNSFQKNLFQLHLRQFTGKVTLAKDQVQKTIYFRKGNPTYVASNVRSETLGQMLVEAGRLTSEQYQKALDVMQQTKKRQGEVLVELGFLTPYQVFEALQEQVERKFENCFLMEGSEVNIEKGEEHLEGIPDLKIDFFRIFLDLADLHGMEDDEPFPPEKTLALTIQGREYLKVQPLKSNESKVVRALDGTQKYEEIVNNAPDSSAAETLAHVLRALGFLELRDPPPQHFVRPASEVIRGDGKEPPHPERPVVTIDEKHNPAAPVQPIYTWALRLDRPLTDLLSVGVTTTKAQIKKTYETIIRDLHLDSIELSYPEKDRKIATDVFNRLTLALTILGDDKRRHEYINDLVQKKPAKESSNAIQAEVLIQKSKILAFKKQFVAAEKEIQAAIELMPNESGYLLALADLQMHRAISEKVPVPTSIEATFKKALSLNSTDPAIFFQYGLYAKVTEDFEKAKGCFQKVLRIQPHHARATSELRLVNQRSVEKKRSESGIFRFLKKK